MNLETDPRKYDQVITAIDAHTVGEAARIIIDGLPPLEGATMMEKKQFLEEKYDHLRTAVMLEPRGHNDMFGAFIVDPVSPEADMGVIFMDTGGYLNMCGHCSIASATVAVEAGGVPMVEPITKVVLDTPAGVIHTEVAVEDGYAKEVSILNVPSFLYKEDISVDVPGHGPVKLDISFGGSFFALVDAKDVGWPIEPENIKKFTDLGMKLREEINKTVKVQHPTLDITEVDLVEFYEAIDDTGLNQRNIVIFGNAQVDRSPCGTGTSAKLADLYAKGKLKVGVEITNKSIIGTVFRGSAVEETEIEGGYKGIIPRITGSSKIIGLNRMYLDSRDPLNFGFVV